MPSERYWRTARHAAASFAALLLVLITMLAENQSSQYTASFIGFRRSLHYDEAKDASSFEEIWDWFEKFTNSIGADTLGQINANCGYNKPNLQDVSIDGTNYKLFDPQYQFGACDNLKYLSDPNEKVYISDTGNHELKTVGIFHGRSTSYKSPTNAEKVIQNNEIAPLDATTDARVLEVCDVSPWGEPCVFRDGFADSTVSTLGWDGEVINGYHAFNQGSRASIVESSGGWKSAEFESYQPCYLNVSGELTSPQPDYPLDTTNYITGYESCRKTWVTPGYELRRHCLDAQVTQADAKYAFMISVLNYTSLTEMRNALYGCEAALALDERALRNSFFRDDEIVSNSIEGDKMHGLFIKTSSQGAWIEDSSLLFEQIQFSKLIDRSTRAFSVIAITRNDGVDDLYYAKVSFSFKMLIDGKIILRMQSSYIPIMQYMYGLDGYPWFFREVFIFELFFLLALFLFTIREIHQDFRQIVRFFTILGVRSTAKIGDILSMGGGNEQTESGNDTQSGNEDNVDGNDDVEANVSNVPGTENDDVDASNDVPGASCNNKENLEIGESNSGGDLEVMQRSTTTATTDPPDNPTQALSSMSFPAVTSMNSLASMALIPDDSNWYNIVDWLTIIVGIILVDYRIFYVQLCYDAVNYLEGLDEEPEPGSEYTRHEDNFGVTLEQFSEIEDCEYNIFLIYMAMILLCVVQFFRYLEFDARFGIVARTMRQSLWVLLPVLVVFTTILSTYAVMGTVMYGKYLPEWSTFYNSLGSLFLLILGEFEGYPRMRSVSSSITGLFFWSFVSFVILVLFNMVLAIILTVYDETYKVIADEGRSKKGEVDKKDS